ncbi:MAG: T9SS type A sorting domain-containing protein [Ignavibacterium sp.]|nr:T9SS type A sorting domain-containing protein [Ignavibacterium sp.]
MQRRPLITKIKINGEKVWEKLLIDTTTSIEAIKTTIDDEGNIYTISNQRDFGNTVCYLTKLDKYGDLIWNRIFFFRDDYFASAINLFINSTDIIRITGTYQYWDGNTTEYGTFTTSFDSSGNQIQFDQQQISLPIQFWVTPKLDEADNIYIPLTVVAPSTYTDILIAKISSNDVLEYEKIYSHNNNPNITDDAAEIILFGEDNYAIVGREGGPVSPLNILVLRYGDNITSVVEASKVLLYEFALSQNYPNPFNPSTKISWQSPVGSWQTLKIFDVLGNEVVALVNEYREAGKYETEFNAEKLPSGVYYYQLRAGDYVQTKKMLLLK